MSEPAAHCAASNLPPAAEDRRRSGTRAARPSGMGNLALTIHSSFVRRLRTSIAVATLAALPSAAFAAPRDEPPTGLLLRVQGHAIGAFSVTSTSFEDRTGDSSERYAFETTHLFFGPAISANVGLGLGKRLRLGLEGRYEVLPATIRSSGSLPFTSLDGWMRVALGPTLGYRFPSRTALELEGQLLFVQTNLLGGQAAIAAPENGFPLGSGLSGALVGGQLLWRPFGWDSLFALHGGLLGSLAHTGAESTDTKDLSLTAQLGVTLGY